MIPLHAQSATVTESLCSCQSIIFVQLTDFLQLVPYSLFNGPLLIIHTCKHHGGGGKTGGFGGGNPLTLQIGLKEMGASYKMGGGK